MLVVTAAAGFQAAGFWLAMDFRIQTLRGFTFFYPGLGSAPNVFITLHGSKATIQLKYESDQPDETQFGTYTFRNGRVSIHIPKKGQGQDADLALILGPLTEKMGDPPARFLLSVSGAPFGAWGPVTPPPQ